jgi:hypothetical protein
MMKITGIKRPLPKPAAPIWTGTATAAGKNLIWYYWPRHWLHVQEQDEINPHCWMNVDPPGGVKKAVLKAVREAQS